jgi:hypothetical protein
MKIFSMKEIAEEYGKMLNYCIERFNTEPAYIKVFSNNIKNYNAIIKDNLVVNNDPISKQQIKQDITKSLDFFFKSFKNDYCRENNSFITCPKNNFDLVIGGYDVEEKTSGSVDYKNGIAMADKWTSNHYQEKKDKAKYFILVSLMMSTNGKIAKKGALLLKKENAPLFYEKLLKKKNITNSAYSTLRIFSSELEDAQIIFGEKTNKTLSDRYSIYGKIILTDV